MTIEISKLQDWIKSKRAEYIEKMKYHMKEDSKVMTYDVLKLAGRVEQLTEIENYLNNPDNKSKLKLWIDNEYQRLARCLEDCKGDNRKKCEIAGMVKTLSKIEEILDEIGNI